MHHRLGAGLCTRGAAAVSKLPRSGCESSPCPLLHLLPQMGFISSPSLSCGVYCHLVHGKQLFPFARFRRLPWQSGGDEQEVLTMSRRSAVGPQHHFGRRVSKQASLTRGSCGQTSCRRLPTPGASWRARGPMVFLPGNGREGGSRGILAVGGQLSLAGPMGETTRFRVARCGVEEHHGHLSPRFSPQPPPLTSASAAASWSTRSQPKTSATACRGTRAAASPGTMAGASELTVAGLSSSCGSRAPRAHRYLPDSSTPPDPAPGLPQ